MAFGLHRSPLSWNQQSKSAQTQRQVLQPTLPPSTLTHTHHTRRFACSKIECNCLPNKDRAILLVLVGNVWEGQCKTLREIYISCQLFSVFPSGIFSPGSLSRMLIAFFLFLHMFLFCFGDFKNICEIYPLWSDDIHCKMSWWCNKNEYALYMRGWSTELDWTGVSELAVVAKLKW